jgi:hypothetical protein
MFHEVVPTPVAMCDVANANRVEAGFEFTLVEFADGTVRRYGMQGWSDIGRQLGLPRQLAK